MPWLLVGVSLPSHTGAESKISPAPSPVSFESKLQVLTHSSPRHAQVAAEPYETIAFKLQAREVDRSDGVLYSAMPGSKPKDEPGTWSHWDPDVKTYSEWSPRVF